MAVLDIDKVEAEFLCSLCSTMKLLDDRIEFSIVKHGRLRPKPKPPVENRMVVSDTRLGAAMLVGLAEPARVR